MGHYELAKHAEILAVTAREAVEELDAVREHPEVVEVLRELAGDDRLGGLLNGVANGDPAGYVRDLADGLEPYRHELLHDEPELVERLIEVAAAVQRATSAVPA